MFSKAIEKYLRDYRKYYDRINSLELDSLNYQETIDYVDEVFRLNRYGSYMVILSQLLNNLYNMVLKEMLSSNGINTEDFNLSPKTSRLRDSDPRHMLDQLRQTYASLPNDMKDSVQANKIEELPSDIKNSEFGKLFMQFMERFGHLSDSGNDFSRPSWKETPNVVIDMIKSKQAESSSRKSGDGRELARVLRGKRIIKSLYGRAMRYQEYRELVNSLYTFGYSQFRRLFLHLADLLQDSGLIEERDDIFYLKNSEVRKLIRNEIDQHEARARINQRKLEMEEYEDLVLPEIIFGDAPPLNLLQQKIGMELTGVGTSGGHYSGPARVVRGVGDFGKIKEGDVLVIPYSDVSWTPLFSLAKAVISESGGLLSHCSIVAREYGIPAVVSVDAATQLEDDTILAVDGNNGLVLVLEAEN
jgi:pyruvate,water dikinase